MDLRVAAAELVLLVPVRFALPRVLVDFFVALRLVAPANRLPPTERFDLPLLLAVPLDAVFVLVERRFPR